MKNKEVIVNKVKNFVNTNFDVSNLTWVYEGDENYGQLMLKQSDKHYVVVMNFLKTKWGFGKKRDGSLGISFNYTNKVINDLENNTNFKISMDMLGEMI